MAGTSTGFSDTAADKTWDKLLQRRYTLPERKA